MKILYISPEHISGTLPLLCEHHKRRGNFARYVTLFPSHYGFPEDLELRLPFHPDKPWISKIRLLQRRLRGVTPQTQAEGTPPFWKPENKLVELFFKFRDDLNEKRVRKFMEENDIWSYDLFHLEQGLGFLRDCRIILELKKRGKKFACFYHGNDVRNRGVLPIVHEISDLNLTSELDLLEKYPGIKYLFLPLDTEKVKPQPRHNDKLKIAHATRDRANKGSNFILRTVKKLESKFHLEMVLIENQPHHICMQIKAQCDIYIDQIADKGGWGYGMSSVESLAQGLTTCTCLNQKYLNFISDHPFINVNYDNLENELVKLIEDQDYRQAKAGQGREWVVKTHDIEVVMDKLYQYYAEAGIIAN